MVDLGADVAVASFVDAASAASDLVAVGVSPGVECHRRAAARVLKELRGRASSSRRGECPDPWCRWMDSRCRGVEKVILGGQ